MADNTTTAKKRRAFEDIPVGATLEVWTTGEEGTFTTVAGFGPTGEPKEEWSHPKINRADGTQTSQKRVLKEGRIYKVWFVTAFLSTDAEKEMEIHTRITIPTEDGGVKELREHVWKITGKRPQGARRVLFISVDDDVEDFTHNLNGYGEP